MNIEDTIQYWLEAADNDLKAAESNFQNGHYDWCLFIGHLVLEKILKALWVKNNNELIHPFTHNLLRLAQEAGIILNNEDSTFFRLINGFNLEARYPEYKKEFYKLATKEFTQDIFEKIKEKYQWLKSQLK